VVAATASFTTQHGRVSSGASLNFNPSASAGASRLASATWNFGDGSRPAFLSGHATLTSTEHRYTKPGSYTVTLTLIDDQGNLQSRSRQVTIAAPKCPMPNYIRRRSLQCRR
jgi:PKD repeat protein